jgi:hypothetical protein
MPVEIFQRAARRVTQSTSARSHLWPDKGQPDVTHHSHPRPQPRGGTAWMILEKFLYVLLYHSRKFFNRKRGHINRNVRRSHFGLEESKKPEWTVSLINGSVLQSRARGSAARQAGSPEGEESGSERIKRPTIIVANSVGRLCQTSQAAKNTRSIAAPNHGHRSRKAAAHVKR